MEPFNVIWELILDLLRLIVLKSFSNKWHLLTISSISLRIFWIYEWDQFSQKLDIWGFNLSTRTRQFQSELSQKWFFEVGSTGCYNSYGKTEFWLAPHSHQSLHLMHQIFPKAKIRSRFMILCQTSLNGLPFIFPPPLLYKPSVFFISFIPPRRPFSFGNLWNVTIV